MWHIKRRTQIEGVSERELRRIFGAKGDDEMTGACRKLQNEALHNLYSSLNIIRVLKSGRVKRSRSTHGEDENV